MALNRRHVHFFSHDASQIKPYLLHCVMVLGVALYVVGGAYSIRYIEATRTGFITKAERILENTGRGQQNGEYELVNQDVGVTQRVKRKANLHRSRRCVKAAMKKFAAGHCTPSKMLDSQSEVLTELDACYRKDLAEKYRRAVETSEKLAVVLTKPTNHTLPSDEWSYWSLKDSILFCFTVITTIGYGNVAPQTYNGQLFVIFYGLIGVPCTMLVIANLGKFLAELLKAINKRVYRCFRFICCHRKPKQTLLSKVDENGNDVDIDESQIQSGAFGLFLAFIVYNIAGAFILSSYEPEMDFFKAIYFNFVTLTTIGLGDIVPQSGEYLFLTLIYVALGLALTSIAIEIAADYLKRLHYFGRKLDNVGQVTIWFGSKKLTMQQLVKNLGDQFNLPVNEMEELNLDKFVDDAMKVEAGEMPTLRVSKSLKALQRFQNPNAIRPIFITDFKNPYKQGRLLYVDEDETSAPITDDIASMSCRFNTVEEEAIYRYQDI